MTATLRSRSGLFTILMLLGAVLAACSNQKSTTGPGNPAGETGHADTTSQIVVNVTLNPAAVEVNRRIGITVQVVNFHGRPLEGRHVQLGLSGAGNNSPAGGRLDQVDGFTDPDGKFVTFLFCETDASPTVVAVVEGATGTAKAICGSGTPAPVSP